MDRRERKRWWKVIGLLLFSFVGDVYAISITVNDVECVYEYVLYEGDTISGNFVVVDHGIFWSSDHPGIDFTLNVFVDFKSRRRRTLFIFGAWDQASQTRLSFWNNLLYTVSLPGGIHLHTIKGTSGDKFEFKAPRSGMYKFCFHNPYTTPETVSFYIHVGHIPNDHDLAKDEHLDPINVKIAELREALESVTAEQKYLKAREVRHRHTNESTRKRVISYTMAEYILLALASGLQVVYIRRLFDKSIAYNRV